MALWGLPMGMRMPAPSTFPLFSPLERGEDVDLIECPRLELVKALSYRDGDLIFRRAQAIPMPDEGRYHRLIRTGYLRDPDKRFDSIDVPRVLPKLSPGTTVLVLREMGLGDVLMVSIVLRALAQKYPTLRFVYACGSHYMPLFRDCDFLEDVVPLWRLQGHFPYVVELRGLSERSPLRKDLDRIDLFAQYCGVTVEDYAMPFRTREEERERGRELIAKPAECRGSILFALRGSTEIRTWPQSRADEFMLHAASEGWRVAVVDPHPFELPKHPGILNLTGEISIPDLIALTAGADFVVAPDTGVVHLAEAVGTRCVAIYSSQPPALRVGHYRHVRALWVGPQELACCPCFERGCKALPCLTRITPEHVLGTMERFDSLGFDVRPRTVERVAA